MTFEKKLLPALLFASALSVTACGGSSSSDSNTNDTAETTDTTDTTDTTSSTTDSVIISKPASFETGTTLTVGGTTTKSTGAFTAADIDTANGNQLKASAWTNGWTVNIHGNSTVWTKPASASANNDCPANTTLVGEVHGLDACQLPTTINADMTLTNDNVYIVNNEGTRVGNGNEESASARIITGKTLTINAGTLILGKEGSYLLVTRDNKIDAQGTATSPVVMRSTAWAQTGKESRGGWGGLVLQGNAKDFAGTNVQGEGGVKFYAGTNDADNSGSLKYVVITGAGYDLDGNGNELNGLTLQGVGSGTTISYVQVDESLDDAMEFFGGAVNVDHIALTNVGDDGFDVDNGWNGTAENVFVHMSSQFTKVAGDSRGLEMDGYDPKDSSGNKYIDPAVTGDNVSLVTLKKFTVVGTSTSDSGIVFRRGVAGTLTDFNVTGFQDKGIEIRDRGTLENGTVTDTTTGATNWAGTYNRITINNSDFYSNNTAVGFAQKDDTTHTANAFANTTAADTALTTWKNAQTTSSIQ